MTVVTIVKIGTVVTEVTVVTAVTVAKVAIMVPVWRVCTIYGKTQAGREKTNKRDFYTLRIGLI